MRRVRPGRGGRRGSRPKARRVCVRLRAGGVRPTGRAARVRRPGRALRLPGERKRTEERVPPVALRGGDVPAGPTGTAARRRHHDRHTGLRRVRDVRVHARRRGPGAGPTVRAQGYAGGVLSLSLRGLRDGRNRRVRPIAPGPSAATRVTPGDCRSRRRRHLADGSPGDQLRVSVADRRRSPGDNKLPVSVAAGAAVADVAAVSRAASAAVRRRRVDGRAPIRAPVSHPVPHGRHRVLLPERGGHSRTVGRSGYAKLPLQRRRVRRPRQFARGQRRYRPRRQAGRLRGERVRHQLPGC